MLAKQSAVAAAQRAAERAFHKAIIGAKRAVNAQYDRYANAVQAIGLKKSTENRRGRRASDTTNKSV